MLMETLDPLQLQVFNDPPAAVTTAIPRQHAMHLLSRNGVFSHAFRTAGVLLSPSLSTSVPIRGSSPISAASSPFSCSAMGDEEVVIALGSNLGNRIAFFDSALRMMRQAGIHIISHGGLYESAPAYVTDQPKFLNSAVRAKTQLCPAALLDALKEIERNLGRAAGGIRYGPRPIDLDILFYGTLTISDEKLMVPHPCIWERSFVLAPLMDLYGTDLADGCKEWAGRYRKAKSAWDHMGGDKLLGQEGLKQVMPIGEQLWSWSDKTHLMGILNVTPDSFSDGGKFISLQNALAQAESMAVAGADFIDLGAQSTRPGAIRLTSEEELARLIPVLEAIQKAPAIESIWLSVDTFYSTVATEAVKFGVHIINDVSGGSMDPNMYETVARLGATYVLMHMRGDPSTMQSKDNTTYRNVTEDVAKEICTRLEKAESLGIPAWRIIIDPGLGFSKTSDQNLELIRNLSTLRSRLAAWSLAASKLPMLIGPSRKGFLGKICGHEKPEDRDVATVGAVVAGVANGVDIVRIHNVKSSFDAVRVADAIFKKRCHKTGLEKV